MLRYYNWYNQCPYMGQYRCFGCPKHYSEVGMEPVDFDEELEDEQVGTHEDFTRTQSDVERVIGLVQQGLANEIDQLAGLGINRNVIVYFIREMVDYLDKNYNKYNSPLLKSDITSASEDIKSRYYWIFNIMRLYGVPFPLQMKILNTTIRIAFQNLRPGTTPGPQGAMQR